MKKTCCCYIIAKKRLHLVTTVICAAARKEEIDMYNTSNQEALEIVKQLQKKFEITLQRQSKPGVRYKRGGKSKDNQRFQKDRMSESMLLKFLIPSRNITKVMEDDRGT